MSTPNADLITRARRHAATHPESRDLIEELIERVEGITNTIRRVVSSTWREDIKGEPK
jgi:hypothetical protein